jgi:hypothetical protein
MTDPRLERLRSLDTEATPGPWHPEVDDDGGWDVYDSDAVLVAVVYGNTRPDAALVAAMRNAWPAVVALVELVGEQHHPTIAQKYGYAARRVCKRCRQGWPCPHARAAVAVLDALGDPP